MQVSTGFLHGYEVTDWDELSSFVIEAENLGVHSIWSPEAWGFDGATPLAYLAAKTSKIKLGTGILQIGVRTPTNLAVTAMSLYSMSNGRFILGLGTSGPQVIEGFHGVIFDHPIERTRETIEIMRQVFNGDRVAYQGRTYRLPVREGQGKSIRAEAPRTPQIPIYIASLGPRNLRLTGELADGWKGTSFMPEHADVFFDHIQQGARKAGRSMGDLDLQAGGTVLFTDAVDEAVEALKPGLAFSLGAMGSREFNFYNAAYGRAGYAGEAYGAPGEAMVEAVTLLARLEGLPLDPVYSGKAMAGLIDLARQGFYKTGDTVVFIHTGGMPALFACRGAFDVL